MIVAIYSVDVVLSKPSGETRPVDSVDGVFSKNAGGVRMFFFVSRLRALPVKRRG